MNPTKYFTSLVNETMASRRCSYAEASRITCQAHPDAATLMRAYGSRRATVEFLNSKLAHGAQKQFVNIVMPGQLGRAGQRRPQFANAGQGAPIGNQEIMDLLLLPKGTSVAEFLAAWEANGGKASPIDYAKIFDGLVQLDMKSIGGAYSDSIGRCKDKYPQLWNAVDALAKMPV
jgi:hypothetical protein